MNRVRALFLIPGFAGNGISRSLLDLVAALRAGRVDAGIFSIRPLDLGEVPHADAPELPIQSGGLPASRRGLYRLPLMWAQLLWAAWMSDVVVASWEVGWPLVTAYGAARMTRTPVVAMVQSAPGIELDHYHRGLANRATRWVYPRFDQVVCADHGLVPLVGELGVPPERVWVVPPGIDVRRTRELAAAHPPDWLPEGPFIASVGRLAHAKGFDLLIRAHAALRAAGHEHRLVLMGQGEEQEALEALIERLGVRDTVLLPGFEKNPFPVLKRATALCVPSRFEGWGLAAAEGVTLGVPIIASDLPGIRSILADGRLGELVEPDSLEPLTEALGRHLRDPEALRARVVAAGVDGSALDVSHSAEGYEALLADTGARRPRRLRLTRVSVDSAQQAGIRGVLKHRVPGLLPAVRKARTARRRLRMLTTDRLRYFRAQGPDRVALENAMLPAILERDDLRRVLFVGTEWYTRKYPDLFTDRELWTLDIDPLVARFGAPGRHIVDSITNVGEHFEPGSLDAILCHGVFGPWLEEKEVCDRTFSDCFDLLRPGGVFELGWSGRQEVMPHPPDTLPAFERFERWTMPPFLAPRTPTFGTWKIIIDTYRRPDA
jgi:glycosyltransferase involved in cell wall biosynthesis